MWRPSTRRAGKVSTDVINSEQAREMVDQAIAEFPETFGLRAFPGDVFKLSSQASYVNDGGQVQLYTMIKKEDAKSPTGYCWLSFAKGTANELRREIVRL
jgi:hypothetical protein